ncbi:MAG: hypothetical protein IJG40_04820 [Oscillospiraceae bacterium]|nr:hypothetical protein [Oscillospiraceae bacterium]
MKISDHFNKGPVQDLLNAVVVQAAEDYREYSAKLLVHPDDQEAAEGKEEVESFFLSEDFCFYTKVGGDYILKKLKEEQKAAVELASEFREKTGTLVKIWHDFSAGGFQDTDKLEMADSLIRRVKEIQKKPPTGWKKLFVFKTAEKNAIKKIERWRKEHERKDEYA